jgi:DNA repair exonuclease SbcCD nuclease subunit
VKKFLVVGDVHAVLEELKECESLTDYLCTLAKEQSVTDILFLGDIHHTHSVLRVEVMHFWNRALSKLAAICNVHVIVGNHDIATGTGALHSLLAYDGIQGINIISRPTTLVPGVWAFPYTESKEEFRKWIDTNEPNVLFCHQTFDGATYENGFYAKDACSSAGPKLIISGHIHTPMRFDNVWYMGAPRWRSVSDANLDRHVWTIVFDDCGNVVNKQAFPTDNVCQRLVQLEETEPNTLHDLQLNPNWKYIVDIKGSAQFVNERKTFWAGKARIRTFVQSDKTTAIKESEGIPNSLKKHIESYKSKYGTPTIILSDLTMKRIYGQQ